MEKIFTTREIERMKNRITKLQWDGKDHIGELEKYIKAKNADFGKEIEKALVRGLKIFLEEKKSFGKTRVLISEKQGIGRSVFCTWITSLIPNVITESFSFKMKKEKLLLETHNYKGKSIIMNGQKNIYMEKECFISEPIIVVDIESIDSAFMNKIDIKDIYAQAYYSYKTASTRLIDFCDEQ